MRIIHLSLVIISCLMISDCKYNFFAQCFIPFSTDSGTLNYSLTMSDKYLAVGDSKANRVAIYVRNKKKKWTKVKEITAPKNSTPDKVGHGFGKRLALDQHNLIISVSTSLPNNQVTNPKDFQWKTSINSIFRAVYQVNLRKEFKIERIDIPTKGIIPSSFIAADGGKIVFVMKQIERSPFSSQVVLFANGKIDYLPKQEHSDKDRYDFVKDLALKNNIFLLGSVWDDDQNSAWLFDLNEIQIKPQKISVPNAILGASVAISDQFIAVSHYSRRMSPEGFISKTLIKSIKNGSSRTIDNYGSVSLDGNIMTIWHHGGPNIVTGTDLIEPDLLEVFRLDEDATPHLIKKRKGIKKAYIGKNLLATVKRGDSNKEICIESVH